MNYKKINAFIKKYIHDYQGENHFTNFVLAIIITHVILSILLGKWPDELLQSEMVLVFYLLGIIADRLNQIRIIKGKEEKCR